MIIRARAFVVPLLFLFGWAGCAEREPGGGHGTTDDLAAADLGGSEPLPPDLSSPPWAAGDLAQPAPVDPIQSLDWDPPKPLTFTSFNDQACVKPLWMADIDGDGADDVLCSVGSYGSVLFWGGPDFAQQYGEVAFGVGQFIDHSDEDWLGTPVDLDGDGRAELLSPFSLQSETADGRTLRILRVGRPDASSDIQYWEQWTSATELGATALPDGRYTRVLGWGDVDGDGRVDVLTDWLRTAGPSGLAIWLQQSAGVLSTPQLVESTADHVRFGDLTGEGRADALTLDATGFDTLLSDGAGQFSAGASVAAPTAKERYDLADLDGDGLADLIYADDGGLWLRRAQAGGTLGAAEVLDLGIAGMHLSGYTVADFDQDGQQDVLAVCWGAGPLPFRYLRGRGDGSFEAPLGVVGALSSSIVAGDFDGDGRTDFVSGGSWVRNIGQ